MPHTLTYHSQNKEGERERAEEELSKTLAAVTIQTIHHCDKLNTERNSPLEALVRMSRGGWQCVSEGDKAGELTGYPIAA